MSGALAVLGKASNVISGISQIAGILGFGAAGPVTLGSFAFADFEVPASINFGGQQQMTVHKLPGGDRIIDVMGPDPMPVTWSGIFLGPNAASRARQLDALRIAGAAIALAWGTFTLSVVIGEFSADYRYAQIAYRISCTVLRDDAASPVAGAADTNTSILSDISGAVGYVTQAAGTVAAVVSKATSVLNVAATFVPGAARLVAGTSAALGVLTNLQAGSAALAGGIASTGATIASLAAGAPVGGLLGSVAALPGAVSAAANHAALVIGSAYAARAAANTVGASS